ncbi:MAG: T9SS type A sorting domain-containing protein [Saprospiraceae bacterium]
MKIRLIAFLLFSNMGFLKAQHGAVSGGGGIVNAEGSLTFSLGQIFVLPTQSADATITPGLQQPYEISQVVGIDEDYMVSDISVYPNPVLHQLSVEVSKEDDIRAINYSMTGADGKNILSGKLSGNHETIEVGTLLEGIYFLRFYNEKQQSRVFKIIKQ